MSTLREVVQEYVTLGFKLVEHDRLLAHFVDYLDQTRTPTITIEAALAWATQPTTAQPARWKARLCVVRGFARHLHVVDPRVEVPPVDLLPCRYQRPTPSLFSPEDIAALLAATHHIKSPLRAATFGALFGLLATTGMRVGEAIRLDDADVDLTVGLLTVRQTKFSKSRQVPVHTTTVAALGRYAHTRERLCSRPQTPIFFVSMAGTRLVYSDVRATFRKLVTTAGIRPEFAITPRINDLRHSFAVATLQSWYRDGGDVQARLPLLSAYLGHSHPNSTYWYLQAAPELLALAASRLEHPAEVLR